MCGCLATSRCTTRADSHGRRSELPYVASFASLLGGASTCKEMSPKFVIVPTCKGLHVLDVASFASAHAVEEHTTPSNPFDLAAKQNYLNLLVIMPDLSNPGDGRHRGSKLHLAQQGFITPCFNVGYVTTNFSLIKQSKLHRTQPAPHTSFGFTSQAANRLSTSENPHRLHRVPVKW
eukprot:2043176-Amphidinium_carterae.1